MKYDVSIRYPSYLAIFLQFSFLLSRMPNIRSRMRLLDLMKKRYYDLYNIDHLVNIASAPCCNQNFNEISKYLSTNNFVFIRYNQKQYVVVDKYKASLTFGDLLGIAAFSSAPKSENIEHIVVNNGTITEGNVKISGTIKDQNDEPIIGANIILNQENYGSSTDVDGTFLLDVTPGNYTANITAIGFNDKIVRLTATTNGQISITLLSEATQLDEIVVTERVTGRKCKIQNSRLERTHRQADETTTFTNGASRYPEKSHHSRWCQYQSRWNRWIEYKGQQS